jgi:hypothetical protein
MPDRPCYSVTIVMCSRKFAICTSYTGKLCYNSAIFSAIASFDKKNDFIVYAPYSSFFSSWASSLYIPIRSLSFLSITLRVSITSIMASSSSASYLSQCLISVNGFYICTIIYSKFCLISELSGFSNNKYFD